MGEQRKMHVEVPAEVVQAIRECAAVSNHVTVRDLSHLVRARMLGSVTPMKVVELASDMHEDAIKDLQDNPFGDAFTVLSSEG